LKELRSFKLDYLDGISPNLHEGQSLQLQLYIHGDPVSPLPITPTVVAVRGKGEGSRQI
jgi:hypothetical protein